jgi:phosphate transport system permease protein
MKERGYTRRQWTDRVMLGLSTAAAGVAILLLLLILGYTVGQGISYINPDIITQPATSPGQAGGGMRDEIIGTLILIGIASVIALPIGLMTGIFLSEFGGQKTVYVVRFIADILAGVPSIIVGVFVYAIVVSQFSYSAYSGGIALAVIMIPVVARTSEEAMRLVPDSMREAALALGITRWRSVLGVVIPGALTGIATGIMLGIARIAGETAPLLFTAFGNFFGFDGLDQPVPALPLTIFRYALSPYPEQNQLAWAGAFLLVIMVLIISILVRWISTRRRR